MSKDKQLYRKALTFLSFSGPRSAMKIRYPALETLWLDDNKLCDQVTFATLAGLRK